MARKIKKGKIDKTVYAVVGEGETEQFYFRELKQANSLMQAVDIKPELPNGKGNSSIYHIEKKAQELLGMGYDKVYCIIDMDIERDNTLKQKYRNFKKQFMRKYSDRVVFIENKPCLEYWFYLHFRTGGNFPDCSSTIKQLKKYIPNYEKAKTIRKDYKDYLQAKEATAIQNAKATNTGSPNYSEMHLFFGDF